MPVPSRPSIASPALGRVLRAALALAAALLALAAAAAPPARAAEAASAAAPPSAAAAQLSTPLPPGVARVASVEGITEYRLENGLRVLLFPEPSKPTITVNITYLVGSRHEDYGETGMAHLLEHLAFKGTPNHPNIPQELTEHGCRPNGTTWWDRTNYFETFRASDENLDWALALEADRMVSSFIAKKDLDSEMTVVRNEFEMGENDPASILEERTVATAFLWHNYGKSTIGARSDIENVPIERLQAFYRNYYQPDNAVLLVAGRIDEAKTLALVHRHFARIPRPSRLLRETYTLDPTQDGERTVTLRRVGDVQAVCAAYHVPAGSHPDAAAVDVLAELLGNTPMGRLHAALVETKKASEVEAYQYQLREPGILVAKAEVRLEDSADEARDLLVSTVEGVVAKPPAADEVDRARASLLKQIELTLRDANRIGIFFSEWIGMGDWRLFFIHRDRLEAVTPDDVLRVARTYLKPSNRTVGVFVPTPEPDRAEIPPAPAIASLVEGYAGEAAMAAGEEFDPSPAVIDARTRFSTLPNGAEVALLPKRTRGGTVNAAITIRFGSEADLRGRATDGRLAAQMLLRGTARHTREEIQQAFDRLKALVNVAGEPTQANVTVETVRESLPEVLRLVAEVLREPSFPPDEFEQLREERLAAFEEMRSDPMALAGIALSRHLKPFPEDDVRYTKTPEEAIAALRAARVDGAKRFHGDFYGASNAQIAVVGDFDAGEVEDLLGGLFGSWKSPRPFARVPEVFHAAASLDRSIETPDKANAMFLGGLNLRLRDEHPDYPALVLGNFLLGGGFLNSRLAVRIRQKEGLSYGVGSSFSASAFDERGDLTVYAIAAPENVSRVQAAVREEIERALRDGFTAEEVEAGKSGWLQGRQVRRSQDGALAGILVASLFAHRTLAWEGHLETKVAALSPDAIAAALKRHIAPEGLAIVKAGDFAKAAAKSAAEGVAAGSH